MSRYVIGGGRDGKERLKLLSEVLSPTTSRLFEEVGLGEGMSCLDVGCGGGFVSLAMARMVGPKGRVVGIDADGDILALARQDAEAEDHGNVEYRHADATLCQGEAEYDLVYARFVLTHLAAPEKCLDAMVRACKPNGAVVVEDIDFEGNFCYPRCPAYEAYTKLYQEVVRRRGGDATIGPKLPGMLRNAGVAEVRVGVVQPTHMEGEAKLVSAITMERIAGSLVSEGLATEGEVDEIVAGLREAAADPEIVMSFPRVFQVWGRKR